MTSKFELSKTDRSEIDQIINAGKHQAKVIKRALALLSFSNGIRDSQIEEVLTMSRSTLWRTRTAYVEAGLHSALYDNTRSGRPKKSKPELELQFKEFVDKRYKSKSQRPHLIDLLKDARKIPGLEGVSLETVRRLLSKNT